MQEISLSDLFKIVYRRLALIIVVTVAIAGVVAWGTILRKSSHYEAKSEIILKPANNADTDMPMQNAYIAQTVATGKDIMQSDEFLDTVAKKLADDNIQTSASALKGALTVDNQPNSLILLVKVTNPDSATAKTMASTIAKTFKSQASHYLTVDSVVAFKTQVPTLVGQTSRSKIKNLIAGIVMGGVVALVLVFLLEFSKHTVRDVDYLEKKYQIKTLQSL